jgi:hypothetical protein
MAAASTVVVTADLRAGRDASIVGVSRPDP